MATVTKDEVWELFREVARRFEEIDLKFKETDRLIKELRESQKETDRQFKVKASDRKQQKLEDLFTCQWEKLMEFLVEGNLVAILNQRGLAINDTATRLKRRLADGGNVEFDILAHSGNEVVVIEVKTTLHPDDVKKFRHKLEQFKQWLPRYANNTIYGGMAWLTAVAGAEDMVQSRGLFSIRATGDSAAIVNPVDFQPKAW